MRLDTEQVLSKTPREFSILMAAQVERQYDEFERMAEQAMMIRAAYHAKRLKPSQLFKRPVSDEEAKDKLSDAKERMERRIEQLEKFEEFRGKFNDIREEETNG